MTNTAKDSLERWKQFYSEPTLLSEGIPPEETVTVIQVILINVYEEEITEDNLWRKAEQRLLRGSEIESLEDRRHYLQLWHAHTLYYIHRWRKEVSEATTWPVVVDSVATLEVLRDKLREIENELEHLDIRWEFHHRIYRSEIGRQPHVKRNTLYDQISEDAKKMWQEGCAFSHTEMAQHWKNEYDHLSEERLRVILKPIASNYGEVATPGRPSKPGGAQEKDLSSVEPDMTKLLERTGYKRWTKYEYDQKFLNTLVPKPKKK